MFHSFVFDLLKTSIFENISWSTLNIIKVHNIQINEESTIWCRHCQLKKALYHSFMFLLLDSFLAILLIFSHQYPLSYISQFNIHCKFALSIVYWCALVSIVMVVGFVVCRFGTPRVKYKMEEDKNRKFSCFVGSRGTYPFI